VELLAARDKIAKKARAKPGVLPDPEGILGALDWEVEYNGLLESLREVLRMVISVALTEIANQIFETLIPISWDIYDTTATALAKSYAYNLVKGLTDSTRKMLGEQISVWIQSGERFEDLIQRVRWVMPGGALPGQGLRDRAQLVSQTEVTRIFAESHYAGQLSAGLTKVRWRTAEDEIVCPICGALGAANDGLGALADVNEKLYTNPVDGQTYEMPAHPGCRCYCIDDRAEMDARVAEFSGQPRGDNPATMGFDWWQPAFTMESVPA